MAAPPLSASGSRGRWQRILGVVLIALGMMLGAWGVISGVAAFARLQIDAVVEDVTIDADSGEELALYRTGVAGEGACLVVGPDGERLDGRPPFGSETLTSDGVEYLVDTIFTVRTAGTQVASCSAPGFAIGPRVPVFSLVGVILGGVFGGIAMAVVGVIVLVIGFARRDRTPPPPLPGPWPVGG